MSFLYSQYLPVIILIVILLSVLIIKINKRFFCWVEDHWFLKRSMPHRFSTILYLLGCSLLLFALMDLRGPEELISGKTSDQKTVIMVDSSASMLAEDVRPNRFSKALLLVKHYVRKAVGQKISLLVFSDGHKKIVPFTDDYNLIDARIDTLKGLNLSRGGTGLRLALKESIQYLTTASGKKEGNILIFTDAEETDGGIELDIPDGVSVAIIGIGTSKGAPIPIRNNRGVFKGNKKHQGKVVITKLDNKFLDGLKNQIKNYRYWVATSYSLPTEEIISFFSNIHDAKDSENEFRIKPVLSSYLMIPGVLFIGLSFIFGRRKTFILMSMLLMSFLTFAQAINRPNMPQQESEEEKEPVKSEKTLRMEEKFVRGELSSNGKKALAVNLLKDNFPSDSAALYKEILDEKIGNSNKLHHFNHATALIKNKKIASAINKYKNLLDYLEQNDSEENQKIADKTKLNILKALQSGGQGSSESKDKEENESDDDNKSDGESKDQKKSDKKDDKNKEGKNEKEKEKKEDQKKDKGDKDKKKKQKNKKETSKEKKERKKKLPALLKQLLSDDNKLQKKMIDAKTTERKSRDKKDW